MVFKIWDSLLFFKTKTDPPFSFLHTSGVQVAKPPEADKVLVEKAAPKVNKMLLFKTG
jgi:hypothetical protein